MPAPPPTAGPPDRASATPGRWHPGHWIGQRFWVTAYVMLVLGLWLPGDWRWLEPAIPVALGGILFFTCLKVPLTQVGSALRDGPLLARMGWMTALKLALLPLLAWAICLPWAGDWAGGVLLVCLMPAGLSSAALADLYRGNALLALLLVLASSLLCPLTVPLLLAFCGHGGHVDPVVLLGRAGYIVLLLGIPFAAAQACRGLAPALVERHRGRWGAGSIACLCLLIFIACASQRSHWDALSQIQLLMPLLAATVASLVMATAGLVLRRRLPPGDATAFACGAIYMNNGLAVAFATRFYPGDAHMLLPCILMQVPMVAGVAVFGRFAAQGRDDPGPEPAPPDG